MVENGSPSGKVLLASYVPACGDDKRPAISITTPIHGQTACGGSI